MLWPLFVHDEVYESKKSDLSRSLERKYIVAKMHTPVLMTVRGYARGELRLMAQDGAAYTCPREQAMGALFGDEVLAKIIGREYAVVTRVEKRAHEEIVGLLKRHHDGLAIIPLERRLPSPIPVDRVSCEAERGDIVLTRGVSWENEGGLMVEVVSRVGSFKKAKHAIDALILTEHLPACFEDDALAEANACREAKLCDDPEREDLRGLLTFTIDGADAKDFDDAVSIEPLEGGLARLYVHIADVGHYVPRGSALDREAYLRGTSVYFPGRVLPMLPEQLSNGVCSLRPEEDKFTLSAIMEIDEGGKVVASRLARTITRSNARLIYDEVNALFDGDPQMNAKMADVKDALLAMRSLARGIRRRREKLGAIDFDTDEPKFLLDEEGEPLEMMKRARGEAEMLIEDFMLAANETVAAYGKANSIPLLYRVHEKPDPQKLELLSEFLAPLGVNTRPLSHDAPPAAIQSLLRKARGWPEFSVISTLALRAMAKARYDAAPLGHYGLALEDYCHFTSPIRRYPDLVVSRAITACLKGERYTLKGDALAEAAQQSSDRERAAMEAERMADKIMTARAMAGHVGEEYSGVVSAMAEWGVFVALPNGAEGVIPVKTLEDWFDFDERKMTMRGERTGFTFTPGLALRVRVESVDLTQGAVNLSLLQPLKPKKKKKAEKKKHAKRSGKKR